MEEIFYFASKSSAEIITDLKSSSERGLSYNEARDRLKISGGNVLDKKKLKWYKVFFRQFKSSFTYLLILAGLVALFLGEISDGLMIFIFLFINVFLGFFQEYRSEKTVDLLKQLISSKVKTLRGGKLTLINSERLVPGDVIIMETGDKIPADIRFIETDNISVDESSVTGESISVNKNSNTINKEINNFFDARNIGFSGTLIVNGSGRGIVIATGANSSIGKISALVYDLKSISGFEKGINSFSNFIIRLIFVTLALIFSANLFLRPDTFSFSELLLFSIALTVGVIPEALPLVTTFALSYSARNLAKKKVIVKRLSAVEDLGGVEIFCSDKTGTLTENSLKLAEIWSEKNEEAVWYANLAASDIKNKKTEPFDIALFNSLGQAEKNDIKNYKRIYCESFNPDTKRNIVVIEYNGIKEIIFRGAPESILEYCGHISKKQKMEISYWIKQEGMNGHRVLAVASKKISKEISDLEKEANKKDKDFVLKGVISFVDPIKKTAFSAIRDARKLGIQIKIITGDSPEVSGAVAYHIGLIDSPENVISSSELSGMNKEEYRKALEEYSVFSRITPKEKYNIIETLQEKYEVGFLGEGINDAPALKIAGVSVVVDSASDIARESSDIILLDKSLRVIIDGIKEGRTVFANTIKYIKSTLASNFGNFFAVASASLMIDFLPMLPVQILLINLFSDFPMIAMCSDSVDPEELKTPKKYEVKDIVIIASLLGIISSIFDFIFFGLFYQTSPEILRTNWFIGSILTELIFIFSIRTKKVFYKSKKPSRYLFWLSLSAAFATISITYTDFGKNIFGFVSPSFENLLLILSIVFVYFIITEITKILYYRNIKSFK